MVNYKIPIRKLQHLNIGMKMDNYGGKNGTRTINYKILIRKLQQIKDGMRMDN